jgi:hypothetical protein
MSFPGEPFSGTPGEGAATAPRTPLATTVTLSLAERAAVEALCAAQGWRAAPVLRAVVAVGLAVLTRGESEARGMVAAYGLRGRVDAPVLVWSSVAATLGLGATLEQVFGAQERAELQRDRDFARDLSVSNARECDALQAQLSAALVERDAARKFCRGAVDKGEALERELVEAQRRVAGLEVECRAWAASGKAKPAKVAPELRAVLEHGAGPPITATILHGHAHGIREAKSAEALKVCWVKVLASRKPEVREHLAWLESVWLLRARSMGLSARRLAALEGCPQYPAGER